jgi:anti-sigma-K factor RskA
MNDRDLLAAEHALGLLDGEQLVEARGLVASDPAFARAVEQWQERLAPLFDEIGEEAPPEGTWERIRAAIAAGAPVENVVELKRNVRRWKGISAAASAIAASLALVVAYDATRLPPAGVQPTGEVMVAALMSDDKDMVLKAAWRPDSASLTVMPEAMPEEPGMAHELWIIPADGKPRSLGMIEGSEMKRMPVHPDMAELFEGAPMLALSLEQIGETPDDVMGPMVASGQLQKV